MKKWLSFKGRIGRYKYIEMKLILIASLVVFANIAILINFFLLNFILLVLAFAALVSNYAITVKRLHDINRSGFYVLGLFIPLYNFFIFAILIFEKGNDQANQYDIVTN